jgi:fructokinase
VANVADLARLGDQDWRSILTFAAAAAALDRTRQGCDPPRRGEVAAFLDGA